jgi:hypothetical protein
MREMHRRCIPHRRDAYYVRYVLRRVRKGRVGTANGPVPTADGARDDAAAGLAEADGGARDDAAGQCAEADGGANDGAAARRAEPEDAHGVAARPLHDTIAREYGVGGAGQ